MIKLMLATLALTVLCAAQALAAESRSTADVDRERIAEYNAIFDGGAVMGYTAHDHQIRHSHDHGAKGGEMAEGAKCGGHGGDSCCEACCPCRDGWYDCWDVWQTDDWSDFTSIRESDYDPVMGRGEFGRSWRW